MCVGCAVGFCTLLEGGGGMVVYVECTVGVCTLHAGEWGMVVHREGTEGVCTLQAGELRNLEGELIMPELPPRKGSGIFACFAPQPCAHRNRRPRLRPCTAAPDLPAARHPAKAPATSGRGVACPWRP